MRRFLVRDKPTMAMISTDVRRDLLSPIQYFRELRVIHFYKYAPYSDLYPGEFDQDLIRYTSVFDLCHKIRKHEPDIIQGSEPYGFPRTIQACTASFLMSKFLNVPLFFPMLENRPPEIKFGPFGFPLLKKYLKIYARHARAIFYLNNGAKRNLLDVGVAENKLKRCMWGTWGVDIDEFTPEKNGLEPNFGRAILYVGKLEEAKGIKYLLPAFKKVSEVIKGVKLVVIGDGPLRGGVERYSKDNNMEENIVTFGIVKHRDLPPYFRAVDLTVTPSITTKRWEEQIGMVNIQSMACGTPVVSTRSGAIPEYVKHDETGILVPERDVDSLASAIKKLLEEGELRKKFGKNARKYVVENFDAKKNIETNEKIVLDLLSQFGM